MRHLRTPQDAASWLQQKVTGRLRVDSRTVRGGDGFVAWPGAAKDGRAFVASALAQGASACLVELEGMEAFGLTGDAVAAYAGLKADAGLLGAAYFGWPSRLLDVIAVTGTNGKTSTTWWLAQALSATQEAGGGVCGLLGTFGSGVPDFIGIEDRSEEAAIPGMTPTGLTTPDPIGVQEALHDFARSGLRYCALEASSIGLAERRLHGVHIRTAVFTNFTQDHLDYHGSMGDYWAAKQGLFDWPGLQAAVVNIDDIHGSLLAEKLAHQENGPEVWTCSCEGTARISAQNIQVQGRGLTFDIVENSERCALTVPLIGFYNVANVLGVVGALRTLGHTLEQAVHLCRKLSSVPGRMDCLGGPGEPMVAVDYAHTPDALEKALTALRPYADAAHGKLICVFGCGGERDAGKRPVMGDIASRLADKTIVTNDNPRFESAASILEQICAGIPVGRAFQVEADRARAIQRSIQDAEGDDVILIAGKGHESHQEIAGIKQPFSDRLCAKAALAKRRHSAASALRGG